MFAIEVDYLSRVVATQYNDRSLAEWPPHFARLFSALVATYEAGERSDVERDALDWLAAAPAPQLYASPASRRAVHTHFVPVNDIVPFAPSSIDRARQGIKELETKLALASAKEKSKLQKKYDKAQDSLEKKLKAALWLLPEHRKKQARTFPSVTPEDSRVYWIWPETEPPSELGAALDGLARSLVRVGHSSTLVRARVVVALPEDVTPNWIPDPEGPLLLRVPRRGQLSLLEQAYAEHRGVEPRVLPFRWQRYAEQRPTEDDAAPTAPHPQQVFSTDDWIVFERAEGPDEPRARRDNVRYLPLSRGADLARRVRDALISFAAEAGISLPEVITGHRPDGRPSDVPHMAVVPLAYVGGPHADGKLRGVALILPRAASPEDRLALLRAVGTWEEHARVDPKLAGVNEDLDVPVLPIFLGRAGVFHMTRLVERSNMRSLRPRRWTRPAHHWRSVTPVALDRNPGNLHSENPDTLRRAAARAEESVRRACERQRLPSPVEVDVSFAPGVSGTIPATRFPPFPVDPRPGKPRRVLVHVTLRFAQPVEGPLLLGAGRYYGLGLFLPLPERRRSSREVGHDA